MARETDDAPRSFGHFFGMLDDEQAHATASKELHSLLKVLREVSAQGAALRNVDNDRTAVKEI